MTLEPRPSSSSPLRDVRDQAREQARTLSAGLIAALGAGAGLLLVGLFVVLDYKFDQDPHRLFKLLLGAVAFAGILMRPKLGLFLLPIVTPFLPWVPPAPVPGLNPLNILLFSVFGMYALTRIIQQQPMWRNGRLGGIIIAMLIVAALSVVRGAAFPTGYSYDARDTGLGLFRSATTFAPYFIGFAMVAGPAERKRYGWAVVLGLALESIVTIMYGRSGSGGRAVGSFGQSNELGAFLAMFTVYCAALVPAVENWFQRVLLLGFSVTGTIALIFTLSRGSLVAFAAGLLVVAFRSSRVMLAIVVVAFATCPFWAPDYLVDRIMNSQVEVEGSDEVAMDTAALARIETWRSVLKVVEEHPLDGVGFGGLAYVLPEAGEALGLSEVKDSAHNTFLRMIGEMGILGIIVFIVLLWNCWRLAETGIRTATRRFDRGQAVALAAATVALAVSCAFGDRFFSVCVGANFWLACALVEDAVVERQEGRA